jgi:hypothetical protein
MSLSSFVSIKQIEQSFDTEINRVLLVKKVPHGKVGNNAIIIGEITEKEILLIHNANNPSIDQFNQQMCEFIKENKKYGHNEQINVIRSRDMIGHIIQILDWHNYTVYFVVQHSDQENKYLVYLSTSTKKFEPIRIDELEMYFENALASWNKKLAEYRAVSWMYPTTATLNKNSFLI